MQLIRMFTNTKVKNTYGYIDSQKKYEILRTILYVAISISLYIAGYIATKSNKNFLTIVAILGVLPATKSLIGMMMFLRYKSCSSTLYERLLSVTSPLPYQLYDLVFTSETKNFVFSHCTFTDDGLCFITEKDVEQSAFISHINEYMNRAQLPNVEVLIFQDAAKYIEKISNATQTVDGSNYIQLIKEITL